MQKKYHILMGDVTGSAKLAPTVTAQQLRATIEATNQNNQSHLLSPLTVTLGDEFQGVVSSAKSTAQIIFDLEMRVLRQEVPPLHYAWVYGQIDTGINSEIAHGMLGNGLTQARQLLTSKNSDRKKFQFEMSGNQSTAKVLNDIFYAIEAISARWKVADFNLIAQLLDDIPMIEIASAINRDRTTIYRRKSTLMIDAYLALRRATVVIAQKQDEDGL